MEEVRKETVRKISLKKENDSLKEENAALKSENENLKKTIAQLRKQCEVQAQRANRNWQNDRDNVSYHDYDR